MRYGICNIAFIPMRIRASEVYEMTNQLIFGEHFTETEKRGSWSKIILAHDNYEAWIDNKNIVYISEETFNKINNSNIPILCKPELIITRHDNSLMKIPIGSKLINNKVFNIQNFPSIDKEQIEASVIKTKDIRTNIVKILTELMNTPYLWGGRTNWRIDCSGLVQNVFSLFDIKLPRDAINQVEDGENIEFITETLPGDIAFFDDKNGKIIHVGIITGANEITHASGRIKKDRLDHQGIFDYEKKVYTHNLRLIKRIINL